MRHSFDKLFATTPRQWRSMTLYRRFEQIITWLLTLFVGLIIAVAFVRLVAAVLHLLLSGSLDPLNPPEFERLFGMLMTLLIAMEFNHSIQQAIERQYSVVQVKTVVLIAILSLLRKFIILDLTNASGAMVAALALAILALGLVYWLMRERDDRRITPPEDVD